MQGLDLFELIRSAEVNQDFLAFDLPDSQLRYLAEYGKDLLIAWTKTYKRKVYLKGDSINMTIPLDIKLPAVVGGVAQEALVYTSISANSYTKEHLQALYDLENTERPAVLLELATGIQRWCNKAAADLLQLSPEQLLSIKSYDTWCEGEIDKLWAEVRGGNSQFELQYQVRHALSQELINMKTQNKILVLDGIYYRFSEALEASKLNS